MIIRQARIQDAKIMHELLLNEGINTNKEYLNKSIKNNQESIVLENNGIQAFMIIREIPGLKEITHWHLSKNDSIIKTIKKEIKKKPLAVTENENNKKRLSTLKELGFQKQAMLEGIYNKAKAVLLIKK